MRPELPTGTVTFLFTDIEGSTRLLHELGDRYAEVLAEHRQVLREAFERHGGVEVDTQGDAFFVAFARASDGVAAAAEAQRALAAGPVRVRVGIHTGEPTRTEEGYVGMDVHRAARIAAAGHGGQVLVSQSTRDLLDEQLELRDLGEHRLKDLAAPQRLYQLGEGEFPPLKSLYQTNLPVVATPFLGREREVSEVLDLLREARLVTLTGPGGTGKTRLALQAAAEAAEAFEHGVFWVGVAALRDPELVLPTIAQAVSARDDVSSHIGQKKMLLLVDNFEQVVEAAAGLGELLSACPNLKLLVTSREPLHLEGEWEYAVQPLREAEAVALFEQRARAVRADFSPNGEVAEICLRLDCLPLAVELAAARVKVLSPAAILERLEQRLPLLTGGVRNAPERQRTLRATIQWSYDLLIEEEAALFARLAVFVGGSTLDAVEEVCEADLDTMQSLVDKSLVRQSDDRFWMLETIREFALERLRETADLAELERNHAIYYLDLAERLEPDLERSFRESLPVVTRELGNFRTALSWFAAHNEAERRLRLAAALWRFWLNAGDIREAASWLERPSQPLSPAVEASVLRAISWVLAEQGRNDEAARVAEQRLVQARASGDVIGVCGSLQLMAHLADERGDQANALRLMEESVEVARADGNPAALSGALMNLGTRLTSHGAYGRARALIQEALSFAQSYGSDIHTASVFATLAAVAVAEQAPDAPAAVRRSIVEAWRLGWDSLLTWQLNAAALFTARKGDACTAACLVGSVDALHARRGTSPDIDEQKLRELIDAELDARLSSDERAEGYAGTTVPLADAVQTAIASLD